MKIYKGMEIETKLERMNEILSSSNLEAGLYIKEDIGPSNILVMNDDESTFMLINVTQKSKYSEKIMSVYKEEYGVNCIINNYFDFKVEMLCSATNKCADFLSFYSLLVNMAMTLDHCTLTAEFRRTTSLPLLKTMLKWTKRKSKMDIIELNCHESSLNGFKEEDRYDIITLLVIPK